MKQIPLVALSGLAFALPINAATVVDFNFSGVDGTVVQDKATFELTATDTLDANLNINTGVNFQSPSTLASLTAGGQASNDLNLSSWGGSTNATINDAFAGDRHISFTVQASSGFALNLDGASVNFTAWRNGGGAPERFGVLAEVGANSFDVSDQIGAVVTPFGAPGSGSSGIGNTETFSFTFSGAEWDNLTESVEVRLYGWDGTGNMHIQDASITDASVIVVPEPSSSALIGLGALSLILRRKK